MGHILDGAIKLACTSYKSAISNLRNKNIKHFRIRYLKQTKKSKILDVELQYFSKKYNSFCQNVLGKHMKTDGFDLSEIRTNSLYGHDCKLHYNINSNRFTLFIPIKEKSLKNNKKDFISIDPGVRTFITGISSKHNINIGTNISNVIKSYIYKIDNNANKDIPKRIKSRYERTYYKKIDNLMIDVHWKIISYLTSNYNTIFIGNWSTKNIGLKNTSTIGKLTKRIASMLSFYKFKMRLRYKCAKNKVNLYEIHEGYTSRLCSICGWDNKKLGSSKIYNCIICKNKIDRDINGARNILFKGLGII